MSIGLALLTASVLMFTPWQQPKAPYAAVLSAAPAPVSIAVVMKMAARKPSKQRKPRKKMISRAGAAPLPTQGLSKIAEDKVKASAGAAREAHMATIQAAIESVATAMLDDLETQGFAIVDDFLAPAAVLAMRAECESLRQSGRMVVSQSTRWNEESGTMETYDKYNVFSCGLTGGADYHLTPRLVEYCVSLVSTLPPLINARFPEASLSNQVHTNKLAVCLGDGSKYDKHYDNEGSSDLRKLTCLIYLQEAWEEVNGGCFRMFAAAAAPKDNVHGIRYGNAAGMDDTLSTEAGLFPAVDIAPLGGRLLAFWSDKMIHGVLPSFASSEGEHRWALTVWLHTVDPAAINADAEAEGQHFENVSRLRQSSG